MKPSKSSVVPRVITSACVGLAKVDAHDDAASLYVHRELSRVLNEILWFDTAPYAMVHPTIVYLTGRAPQIEPAYPKVIKAKDGVVFLTASVDCSATAAKRLTHEQFGQAMARVLLEMMLAHAHVSNLPTDLLARTLERMPPYPDPNPFNGLVFKSSRKRPDSSEPTLDLVIHIPTATLAHLSKKEWVRYFDRMGGELDSELDGIGECDTFEHGQGEVTYIISGRSERRLLAAAKRALARLELPQGAYFTVEDLVGDSPARTFKYQRP